MRAISGATKRSQIIDVQPYVVLYYGTAACNSFSAHDWHIASYPDLRITFGILKRDIDDFGFLQKFPMHTYRAENLKKLGF
ncbi:hypothetical protein BJX61DRAFT_430803 [Aspergillus egyptiacus]|nr:hypothetical protein BJX61DRAFT_430803 [Aspergillus egyptiacus]